MRTLYVLNKSKDFKGYCDHSISGANINDENLDESLMDYRSGQTFGQLNKEKGGNLIAIEWDEFNEKYMQPHKKSLQTPFEEITAEKWEDMLNCLPPMNWHDFAAGLNVFFCEEAYTADLHGCYIKDRVNKKFYTALRSRFITDEQLLIDFKLATEK